MNISRTECENYCQVLCYHDLSQPFLGSKIYGVVIQKTVTFTDGNNKVRRLRLCRSLHVFLISCSLHSIRFSH